MKKLLNSEYIFYTKKGVAVNVIIDYQNKKYSLTETKDGISQEGLFWGDRIDIVDDSDKAKLVHDEIMPFIAEQFNFAPDENSH